MTLDDLRDKLDDLADEAEADDFAPWVVTALRTALDRERVQAFLSATERAEAK